MTGRYDPGTEPDRPDYRHLRPPLVCEVRWLVDGIPTWCPARLQRHPELVGGHAWLTPAQAGIVIGITDQAVRKRCHRDTIPHVRNAHGFWIREDHAKLAAYSRATDDDQGVAIVRGRVLGG